MRAMCHPSVRPTPTPQISPSPPKDSSGREQTRRDKKSLWHSGLYWIFGRNWMALDGPDGGEGGIRTHGTLAGTPVFETGPIDHSGTSPVGLLKAAGT